MAVARLFLLLAVPILAGFVLGLARLLRTGQVDPWHWAAPCAIVTAGAAYVLASRHAVGLVAWMTAGCIAIVALFDLLSAWPPDLAGLAMLALVIAIAAVAGFALRRRRLSIAVAGLFATLALILWWPGSEHRLRPSPGRPPLAVVSALPLFWQDEKAGLSAPADAPIVAILRTRFDVRALDDMTGDGLTPYRHLLLAQPRALSPQALVALDQWVRDGGQLVALVDPLLLWPSSLPPGDRRRPPVTSLLDPLLRHWGVSLLPATGVAAREERRRLAGGHVVTLAGASHFSTTTCARRRDEPVATCRIGKGHVVLVADADLLNDALWLADPTRPLDTRAWSADNPELLFHWLGAARRGGRRWVGDAGELIRNVRIALLAGLAWAAVGTGLWRGRKAGLRWSAGPASPD
jgi:hypothetical protein